MSGRSPTSTVLPPAAATMTLSLIILLHCNDRAQQIATARGDPHSALSLWTNATTTVTARSSAADHRSAVGSNKIEPNTFAWSTWHQRYSELELTITLRESRLYTPVAVQAETCISMSKRSLLLSAPRCANCSTFKLFRAQDLVRGQIVEWIADRHSGSISLRRHRRSHRS